MNQLVKLLLEQHLGRSNRVRRVGDDHIISVLLVRQELESVLDDHVDFRVGVADREGRKVFLGEADHGLVDFAERDRFDALVLDDLAQNTTVTTANNEDLDRMWGI